MWGSSGLCWPSCRFLFSDSEVAREFLYWVCGWFKKCNDFPLFDVLAGRQWPEGPEWRWCYEPQIVGQPHYHILPVGHLKCQFLIVVTVRVVHIVDLLQMYIYYEKEMAYDNKG